jgi:flagellar protein FlaJ
MFMPLFEDLEKTLLKAELKLNFKVYLSLLIFCSLIATAVVTTLVPFLSYSVFHVSLVPAMLFGVGSGMFTGAASVFGFYFYPVYRADAHKREVDDELPFAVGYMSVLSSAGVNVERIFESLTALEKPLAVSVETREFVRGIKLFGLDAVTSLQKTAERTPSERLRELLEGIVSTMHSGSNMTVYLRLKFKTLMRLKKHSLKKFSDTLSVLAEVYVALLLTGPLLFIIMLSVMSMLGAGTIGPFSTDLLLNLITYVGIPACALVFLVVLDALMPKW